jgi:hypothetical protein
VKNPRIILAVQPHAKPRHVSIDDPVKLEWTFGRRDERLSIRREATAGAFFLIVSEAGSQPRVYSSSERDQLASFQQEMMATLAREGWSPVEFKPERRSGLERRRAARASPDRRKVLPAAGD